MNSIPLHLDTSFEEEARRTIEAIHNRPANPPKKLSFDVSTVYQPKEALFYNNMSGFVECNGRYYVFWATAPEHEDSCGQHILCSVSEDLYTWSDPMTVFAPRRGEYHDMVMWGYPYAHDGHLYCGAWQFEYRPDDVDHRGRGDWQKPLSKVWALVTGENGADWRQGTAPQDRFDPLYVARNSQDLKALAAKGASYFSEGSSYRMPNGDLVALFRSVIYPGEANDGGMNYKWGCISRDNGRSFSRAFPTRLSDAPQMSTGGNLPDGRIYYVGSPASEYERACLMLYLSEDGINFDRQYILYQGIDYSLIKPGIAKNPGYHYPRSLVVGDTIHVGYTLYKETLQVLHIPIDSLS